MFSPAPGGLRGLRVPQANHLHAQMSKHEPPQDSRVARLGAGCHCSSGINEGEPEERIYREKCQLFPPENTFRHLDRTGIFQAPPPIKETHFPREQHAQRCSGERGSDPHCWDVIAEQQTGIPTGASPSGQGCSTSSTVPRHQTPRCPPAPALLAQSTWLWGFQHLLNLRDSF